MLLTPSVHALVLLSSDINKWLVSVEQWHRCEKYVCIIETKPIVWYIAFIHDLTFTHRLRYIVHFYSLSYKFDFNEKGMCSFKAVYRYSITCFRGYTSLSAND